MNLLALDTATDACTAAVLQDNKTLEMFELTSNEHSKLILPMIDALMADAGLAVNQLDGIAFGRGPGSFTGVRIGAGVVQGIAYAADIPVVPVSTMMAIACGCENQDRVAVATDARMQQIYCACFSREANGSYTLVGREQVMDPENWLLDPNDKWKWYGAGNGWAVYEEVLLKNNRDSLSWHDADCYPHAADIARVGATILQKGEGQPAHEALPVYIRDEVAKKPGAA